RLVAQKQFPEALVIELLTEGTSSRWKEFAGLELLEGLSWLVLDSCKMNEAHVRTLAEAPRLGNLRDLGVRHSPGPGRAPLAALAGSPHLAKLTGLDFRGYPLSHEAMELLTWESPWKLTSLSLDGTALHDYAMGLLLEAPWLPGLTSLSVHDCMVYDESVQ